MDKTFNRYNNKHVRNVLAKKGVYKSLLGEKYTIVDFLTDRVHYYNGFNISHITNSELSEQLHNRFTEYLQHVSNDMDKITINEDIRDINDLKSLFTKYNFSKLITACEVFEKDREIVNFLQNKFVDRCDFEIDPTSKQDATQINFCTNGKCSASEFWDLILDQWDYIKYENSREHLLNSILPTQELVEVALKKEKYFGGERESLLDFFCNLASGKYYENKKMPANVRKVNEQLINITPLYVRTNKKFIDVCVENFGYKAVKNIYHNEINQNSDIPALREMYKAYSDYLIYKTYINSTVFKKEIDNAVANLDKNKDCIKAMKTLIRNGINDFEALPVEKTKELFKNYNNTKAMLVICKKLKNNEITLDDIKENLDCSAFVEEAKKAYKTGFNRKIIEISADNGLTSLEVADDRVQDKIKQIYSKALKRFELKVKQTTNPRQVNSNEENAKHTIKKKEKPLSNVDNFLIELKNEFTKN